MVRRCVRDVGHRKEVFPVSEYCLHGSALLSTGTWSLIQQQHKHSLCVWRNYDTFHLLNCVALGICPVNSARSHVPQPLDSLTPKCNASTFPSTELFLSYECTLLIKNYRTYCVSIMVGYSALKFSSLDAFLQVVFTRVTAWGSRLQCCADEKL